MSGIHSWWPRDPQSKYIYTYNMLQCVAVCAVCCCVFQCDVMWCSLLQFVLLHKYLVPISKTVNLVVELLDLLCCRVLKCVEVCCSVSSCTNTFSRSVRRSISSFECSKSCLAGRCRALQGVAGCCSVLQCVAVCCSVLQCVAVCCSVLQCFMLRKYLVPLSKTVNIVVQMLDLF